MVSVALFLCAKADRESEAIPGIVEDKNSVYCNRVQLKSKDGAVKPESERGSEQLFTWC